MSIFMGATINDEHTYRDWNAAISNSDIISVPEPHTVLVDVPGRNGRLDLSEALTGDISYSNRTIKLVLVASVNIQSWHDMCEHIFNKFHGRKVKVTFDDDPEHYYSGRASVSDPQRIRNGASLTLTVDADPFRYAKAEKQVRIPGAGAAESNGVIENSGRMTVAAVITADAECQMVVEGRTYSLMAGKQTFELVIPPGRTPVTLKNCAADKTVKFTFREGWL